MLIDYLYTYYNADPYRAQFFTSNNRVLSTDRFRQIGGFDTAFPRAAGEDRELCEGYFTPFLMRGESAITAAETALETRRSKLPLSTI
jgi:hypothetical protein